MAGGTDRFVLDTSVAVAWCFEDEKTAFTERALNLLAGGSEAIVPAIWPVEVANALLTAEKRRRISVAQVTGFLARLSGFAIAVEAPHLKRAFDPVLSHARAENVTAYDASYLELAIRHNLPLVTLDRELKRAASALGVRLVSKP